MRIDPGWAGAPPNYFPGEKAILGLAKTSRMKTRRYVLLAIAATLSILSACDGKKEKSGNPPDSSDLPENPANSGRADRISVIFDTDANNELDDQHALAYLLMNGDVFDLLGVTVNATFNGGNIDGHYREAQRVLQLCNRNDSIPLLRGADKGFAEISEGFDPDDFDGKPAVDFLLEETRKDSVIILAVGKLTNIALALKKDPDFAARTRVVWLGSNYPEPGEYNQDNDTVAMNAVLESQIPFDMVTVRYGDPSGTDAVKVTPETIGEKMPGLGPEARAPITGRHGGEFSNFGDYSVNLFEHIDLHGDPPSRPLFDMVAVALLKNPAWGQARMHPAPVLIDNQWVERPDNERRIRIWEDFDREGLLADFFETMEEPVLVRPTAGNE